MAMDGSAALGGNRTSSSDAYLKKGDGPSTTANLLLITNNNPLGFLRVPEKFAQDIIFHLDQREQADTPSNGFTFYQNYPSDKFVGKPNRGSALFHDAEQAQNLRKFLEKVKQKT